MPDAEHRGPLLRAIDRSEARAALPPQPPMPRCKDGTLAHFWEFGYSREGNNILDSEASRHYPELNGGHGRYPYNKGVNLIAELWTFADESGLHQDPRYCLVAGYIGAPEQWDRFREQWVEVLQKWNVDDFHARDFFSGKHGYYVGWTSNQASQFLMELLQTIHNHDLFPIGCAVDVDAFMSYSTGERRALTGARWLHPENRFDTPGKPSEPYFVAFMRFLYEALMRTPVETRLHLVFDRQNIMESRAIQTFHEIIGMAGKPGYITQPNATSLDTIQYRSSKDEVALQAADLLVHSWYSYFTQGDAMPQRKLLAMIGLTAKRDTLAEINRTAIESNLTEQWSPEVRKRMQAEK